MTFLIVALLTQLSILDALEQKLELSYSEATYSRYLYYCRQGNEGNRLAKKSLEWTKRYPENLMLKFGYGEGLIMSGDTMDGVAVLKELYKKSPDWATQIIFTLKESNCKNTAWFIKKERERNKNPSLYARLMCDIYIKEGKHRIALAEISTALKAGRNPEVFEKQITLLAEAMGSERIIRELGKTSKKLQFQLALETGDRDLMQKTIEHSKTISGLIIMAKLAEKNNLLNIALQAYLKAGQKYDAARVYLALGDTENAVKILENDNSKKGKEQRAILLTSLRKTYPNALNEFTTLERNYGSNSLYATHIAAMEILLNTSEKAENKLNAYPPDTAILFLKGITAAIEGNSDSLKSVIDRMLFLFPGNGLENDLLLLYQISLDAPEQSANFACALTALYWGDPNDAYKRAKKMEENKAIADEALLLSALSFEKIRHWQEAVNKYNNIIRKYPSSPLVPRAKYQKAMILKNALDSKEEGNELLTELILNYPNSIYANLARRKL